MHRKKGKVKFADQRDESEGEASFQELDQEQVLVNNEIERDLRVPPIEIARGHPVTGKIGSQRPAVEQHNRMVAQVEGYRYKKSHPSNAISRSESNRIYADIRGQLYSPDAFNLPRGELTLGKMRKSHFRKLMLLRKSLEKRSISLRRAVNFWSVDNFIDDVLRRDRIRGLTARSKHYPCKESSVAPRKPKKRSDAPLPNGKRRKTSTRKNDKISRGEVDVDDLYESDVVDDDGSEEYEDERVSHIESDGDVMKKQQQDCEESGDGEESQESDQEYQKCSAREPQAHYRTAKSAHAGPSSSTKLHAHKGKFDGIHQKNRVHDEKRQDDRDLLLLRKQIRQLHRETGYEEEEEDDAFLAGRKSGRKRSSAVMKKATREKPSSSAPQKRRSKRQKRS